MYGEAGEFFDRVCVSYMIREERIGLQQQESPAVADKLCDAYVSVARFLCKEHSCLFI